MDLTNIAKALGGENSSLDLGSIANMVGGEDSSLDLNALAASVLGSAPSVDLNAVARKVTGKENFTLADLSSVLTGKGNADISEIIGALTGSAAPAAAAAAEGSAAAGSTGEVTADTNIIEAVQAHPEIMQVFADYGLGCIGCMASQFESIGEGAGAHGLDVSALIQDINDCIKAHKA